MPDEKPQTTAPVPDPGSGSQTRGATPGQAPGQASQPTEAQNILVPGEAGSPAGGDGLTQEEEDQLAALQAKAAASTSAGGQPVEIRIAEDSGHTAMHHGGLSLYHDRWVKVPYQLVAMIETAAANAGVKLTSKEG